jgi:hypothetical protein
MLRFAETGDLNFGALLFKGEADQVAPGERVELGISLINDEAEARLFRVGQTFVFGDLPARGTGVIVALAN